VAGLLLDSIPDIGWPHILLRLAVAAVLGGAVGLERELRERQAGLRTHMLVCVGAALFTLVSAYGFRDFLVGGGSLVRVDPTRIAAQIVSGIGFLGAGAIIRQGLSVRGLTTAATLWLVAAIGMACGAGFYAAATIASVGAVVTLGPLRIAAFRLLRGYRAERGTLLVQLAAGASPAPVIARLEELGAKIDALSVGHEADRRHVEVDVQLPREAELPRFVEGVSTLENVLEVRWNE
jgi:putative Mg2+ transporter-C (MgtC) family protein